MPSEPSRKRISLSSKKKVQRKNLKESNQQQPEIVADLDALVSLAESAVLKKTAPAPVEEVVVEESAPEVVEEPKKEEETKPSRKRLSLGKKNSKAKGEDKSKEATQEPQEEPQEEPKDKKEPKAKKAAKKAPTKEEVNENYIAKVADGMFAPRKPLVTEDLIQGAHDNLINNLDKQLSSMGSKAPATPELTGSQLYEQKLTLLERQIQDMRRLVLESSQSTIVNGLGVGSPGSGEVNLLKLDDVKEGSFDKESDGQLILWSQADQKFVSSAERGVDNFFSEGIGGYEFTGGFSDREVGSTGASDFGTFVPYTQAMADAGQWRRFGFSEAQQQANDVAYFPTDARPNRVFDQSKGLFGGMFMPSGVTELIDYGWSDTVGGTLPNNDPFVGYSTEVNSGDPADFNYTAANGSFDFRECQPGDLLQLRFDFNVNVQIANTTLEIALIWQTRDANDNPTFTFALTGQPIFYGTGTVGRTFLNRPFLSAYFASAEDTNARALLAIRADNPIQVAPLSTLVTIQR